MLEKIKSTFSSLIMLGAFYAGYEYDILLLKGFFWFLFSLIFVMAICMFIFADAIKSDKFLNKNFNFKLKPIEIYNRFIGIICSIIYVGICYNFHAYNMMSMVILSYITLWSSYNNFINVIKQKGLV